MGSIILRASPIIDRLILPKKTCRSSGAWLDQPGRHTINMALLTEFGAAPYALFLIQRFEDVSFVVWHVELPGHRADKVAEESTERKLRRSAMFIVISTHEHQA